MVKHDCMVNTYARTSLVEYLFAIILFTDKHSASQQQQFKKAFLPRVTAGRMPHFWHDLALILWGNDVHY